MKGFIIYPTYRVINDQPYIALFGRLENGESFLTLNEFKPYFFIKKKDSKHLNKKINVKKTPLKTFQGEPVVKITLDIPSEVPKLRDKLENKKIETYEADIKFAQRFLIDNKLQNSIEIKGDYEANDSIDRVYKNPEITPTNHYPSLKTASIDIETSKEHNQLYCIGLYSKNINKVFMVTKKPGKNYIACKTEEEALENFIEAIRDLDPDIITGWNLIDFDFKCLQEKCREYKIPFQIARDNSNVRLRLQESFFMDSKADIPGRMVLDAFNLAKVSFIKLPDYKLDTAAQVILGKRKIITKTGKEKYQEIDRLYKKDQEKLAEYNLEDCKLAYEILYKGDLLDLTIQRSLITGMPLDKVSASIASLDSLYLKKARKRKLVCPSGKFSRKESPIKGGFVMDSKPGIYDNILVLDFKSLYPSLVRTFNIDPSSFQETCKKDSIKAPNGACFKNEVGIMPEIIQELWEHREKARKEKNELARYAIKILMNSFFGVMASPMSRFFNMDIGNAITYFAQHFNKGTAKQIEKLGYEVIYSDTDSVFVNPKAKTQKEAEEIGKKLEKEINKFFDKEIKQKYKVKSFLELEYEKCFTRFLMPKLRHSEKGAKKRYAGLVKGEIEFTGLESVRGDWTEAAKEFQQEILDRIFHKKEIASYVKSYVEDIKSGKKDNLLIYKKQLRKGLEGYAVNPPHLKAAKKLKKLESNLIEYVITTDGPEPIQNQKHKIDYDHYIDKQIKPIADTILIFFNKTFEEVISGNKQSSLFKFA